MQLTHVQLCKSSWEDLYDTGNFWAIMSEVSEGALAFEYKLFINFNEDQKSTCTSPKLLSTQLLIGEESCQPLDAPVPWADVVLQGRQSKYQNMVCSFVEGEPPMWIYWVALIPSPNRGDANKCEFRVPQVSALPWELTLTWSQSSREMILLWMLQVQTLVCR